MNHLGTKVLETNRLILRPFRREDVDDMYKNWASNDHVTRYLTWPTHRSLDVTQFVVDSWVNKNGDAKNYQWCVEWKQNHQAIGSFGVVRMEEEIQAMEIGYCIGEEYWHQGITAEAFVKVIEYLFEQVGCNRISARHDVANPNSGKVMKKAGLQYEGTMREASKNNTGICDVSVYAITRKQYNQRQSI